MAVFVFLFFLCMHFSCVVMGAFVAFYCSPLYFFSLAFGCGLVPKIRRTFLILRWLVFATLASQTYFCLFPSFYLLDLLFCYFKNSSSVGYLARILHDDNAQVLFALLSWYIYILLGAGCFLWVSKMLRLALSLLMRVLMQ